MSTLSLDTAQALVAAGLASATMSGLKPLAIVVLDDRGSLKAAAVQDGTSLKRFEIAHGKAFGAIALGLGSRSIFKRAKEQPYFVAAVGALADHHLVPAPGGVLIRTMQGDLLGAIGVSGDNSDNDEHVAVEAITALGLAADCGED
jgi:uncharacterized protein GlcG (DUF336 family)